MDKEIGERHLNRQGMCDWLLTHEKQITINEMLKGLKPTCCVGVHSCRVLLIALKFTFGLGFRRPSSRVFYFRWSEQKKVGLSTARRVTNPGRQDRTRIWLEIRDTTVVAAHMRSYGYGQFHVLSTLRSQLVVTPLYFHYSYYSLGPHLTLSISTILFCVVIPRAQFFNSSDWDQLPFVYLRSLQ
jgi:hypothetical protein